MSGGRLVVVDRAGRDVKRFPLAHGLATLGSDLACDIRVLVPRVAPLHATVAVLAAQAVVRNVGDGETLLNGRAVSTAALRHGDLISVGERALRWEYDEPRGRRDPGPSGAALAAPRSRSRPARRSAAAPRGRALLALELRRPASMPPAGGKQVAVVQPRPRDPADAAEPALHATKATLWIESRKAPRRRAPATPRPASARKLVKIEAPLEIDRTKRAAIMLMTGRSAAARRSAAPARAAPRRSPPPRRAVSAGRPRVSSPKSADSSLDSARPAPSPGTASADRGARGSRRSARKTESTAAGDSRSEGSLALRYSSSPSSPGARRSIRRPGRGVESYSVVDLVSLDSGDASYDSAASSPAGRRARSALGASLRGCSTPYAPDDSYVSVADTEVSRTRSEADDRGSSAFPADATERSSLASARSAAGAGTPESRRSPEAAGTPVLSIRSLLESSRGSPAAPALAPRSSGRRAPARPSAGPAAATADDAVTPPGTARLSPEAVKNKHSSAKRPLSKRSIIDDLDRSDIVKQLFSSPVKRKLSRSMIERADEPTARRARRSPPGDGLAPGGLRRLFRASPADDLRDVRGVRELFARAPRDRLSDVRVKAAYGAAPRDDLTDVRGVRRLFQHSAPRRPAARDASGLDELFAADRSAILFDALVGKPPVRAVYSKSPPTRPARRPATRASSLRGSVDEIAGDVEGWLERELQRRLRRPAPPAPSHSTPLRGRRAPAASLGRVSPIPAAAPARARSARSIAAEKEPPGQQGRGRRGRKAAATSKADPPEDPGPSRRVTRSAKAAVAASSKPKRGRSPPAAARRPKTETPKRTRARAGVGSPKPRSPQKIAGRFPGRKKSAATRKRSAEVELSEVSPKNVRKTRAAATPTEPRRGRAAPPASGPPARSRRPVAPPATSEPDEARPARRERRVRFAATPEAIPKKTRAKESEVGPSVAPEPASRSRRARPAAAAPPETTKGRKRKAAGGEEASPRAEPRPKRSRRGRAASPPAEPRRAASARGRKTAAPEEPAASAGGERRPEVEPSPTKGRTRARRPRAGAGSALAAAGRGRRR